MYDNLLCILSFGINNLFNYFYILLVNIIHENRQYIKKVLDEMPVQNILIKQRMKVFIVPTKSKY